MSIPKTILALSASASLCFAAEPIHLLTDGSQMTFKVESSGKLSRSYYGTRLGNPDDCSIQSTTNTLAYPSLWDTKFAEAAVSITQSDGSVSLDLVYESHEVSTPADGQELIAFTLKDSHYPVKVKLSILASKSSNVYEQWVEITNTGDKAITVDQGASGHLYMDATRYFVSTFRGDWSGESYMYEEEVKKGNLLEASSNVGTRTAHEGTPGFVISLNQPACEDTGEVYMGALAWAGNYKLRFKHTSTNRMMATFGADLLQAAYTLDPGKTLTLPRWIVTHSQQGKGEASRQLHHWARKTGIRGGDKERMTLLNSWEGAYFNFDESVLHDMMKNAADIGVELFVLDDGWFANKYPRNSDNAGLGDWDVNHKKLPHGIKGLTEAAKERNIKFGIWVEPEMVNPKSELYEKHPEWVIQLPHRPHREGRNQLGLDLSNPEVQDFIYNMMDKLLGENPDIVYVKWDCNRYVTDPGSTYLSPRHQKNLLVDYVNAYYNIMDKLVKKYPKIVFQACGGGGGRADYGTMKYHHEFWVSDNTDPYERVYMQWSVGHLFPAISMASHVTESPNHQTGRETSLKFRFDVAMTGRLGFELQPKKLTEEEIDFSKKALAEYKRIRPVVQFGDLYRLRSPFETNEAALVYLREENGKQHAVFFAYLMSKLYADSPGPIKLKGLKSDKRYKVKELNVDNTGKRTSLDEKEVGGDLLMNEGIKLRWRKAVQSVVLEITEI